MRNQITQINASMQVQMDLFEQSFRGLEAVMQRPTGVRFSSLVTIAMIMVLFSRALDMSLPLIFFIYESQALMGDCHFL